MLRELTIENIAVIRRASIRFEDGFNVFTGETGAGKSILIGAIGAVLGGRTSKELIRTGESRAVVSALFCGVSDAAAEAVCALGFEPQDGELLLSREITADHNSCRINGMPATVAMLRAVGNALINTHGQQDNQMLTSIDSHRMFVDAFGGNGMLLESYKKEYEAVAALREQRDAIDTDESAKARKMDLLRYQIDEIAACNFVVGEEEELSAKRRMLRNAVTLTQQLGRAREGLCGGDEFGGALALLDEVSRELEQAGRYLDAAAELSQKVLGFRYELDDVAEQLRDQLEALDCDPRQLDEIEERLDLLSRMKRKYGADVAEILRFGEQAQRELEEIELSQERLEKIDAELAAAAARMEQASMALRSARRDAAARFSEAVAAELVSLDMPSVVLEVAMTPCEPGASGADRIEFLLSVNPGEAPRALSKIASGGEISRIMLAIKNVISGQDDIDTLIFDEIDAGISGRAAQKVGAKLHSAAACRQIICVTHLAQVAAFADHHLLIEKAVLDGRTCTEVRTLDTDGRVRELARIMGGEPITELSLQSAWQLLEQSV